MPDTTGAMLRKGLEKTGMGDEDYLQSLWARPGAYGVAVIEFQAKQPHGPNTEGKRRIDFVVTVVEPALTPQDEKVVRDLMQGLYAQRKTNAGELPLDGEGANVESSRTAARAHVDRDEDGHPTGVWDGDTDAERAKSAPAKKTAAKKTTAKKAAAKKTAASS